ncbi:MAG: ABC transporter ATP-binding protein [Alphaproteobacteria bacterium]|nr:ABC transporter ATP-binding protein [Alphaproteobacteria bacterium]
MAPSGHLVLDRVTAGYGGASVLKDVSLSVEVGECVAVWGRNGAGKTTLLRAISGLVRPSSGTIEVDGIRIDALAPYSIVRLGISHVPEGRRIIPSMTLLDNLKLGGFVPGAQEPGRRIDYIYELFPDIRDWGARRGGTLSGGQQQLLALARAMMSRPKLLLLDEPLTGLAPIIQFQVLQALRRIEQERVSVLLVEQNVHQSIRVTSRAFLLEQGRIVLEGATEMLKDDPRIQEGYLGIGIGAGAGIAASGSRQAL